MKRLALSIDADELATCVGCGLCLPHCPTYRVTGDEALSPRGRIAAMRQVQSSELAIDHDFVHAIDTCVQCLGCETACPSGVPYGHLVEATRHSLATTQRSYQPSWRRAGYRVLRHHRTLLALSSLLAIAQRLRLVPSARLGLPRLPIRRAPLVAPRAAGRDRVWLFTGCVMDAWQRPVHAASMRVIAAAGGAPVPTGGAAPCCGALAAHAGLTDDARAAAQQVMRAIGGRDAILVNSAGCGAMLKEYGRLLDTPEAHEFSARVSDIHEWLAPRVAALPAPAAPTEAVIVQDPCHLRHAQRAHQHVRTVLAPFAQLIELDDEGLCCGAGGAYSALQPELARDIRARKVAAIERAGRGLVASANPGCALHLAAAGIATVHPIEIVDRSLRRKEQGS